MNIITQRLLDNSGEKYVQFSKKLIPSTKYEFIGVTVPKIREIAKNSVKEDRQNALDFLKEEHRYYEEYFIHGILISNLFKEKEELIFHTKNFLPHIDNWAICDSFSASLKIIDKKPDEYFDFILSLLKSDKVYTKRFALVSILDYYVTHNYIEKVFENTSDIKSDEYYINMALAWLYCELLVKFYNQTLPYIESKNFDKFVQNKTIQKAVESFRLTKEQKDYLRTLKIK